MIVPTLLLAVAAVPHSPSPTSLDARITAAVTRMIDAQLPVGAAVGVAKDGRLIFINAFGVRDLQTKAPVDQRTRFEIGSVTKQFTAAAILQLQEAGKLSIDDTLAKYFPTFPHASEMSLRELLNQVSGLPDYLPETGVAVAFSKPAAFDYVASRVKTLQFAPGTQWRYSNTNYWLLGQIVAKVSDQSYESYVREHLFAPAGMARSGFIEDEAQYHDLAKAYWRGENGQQKLGVAPEIPESWAGGAGAIVSTVADLVKWDTALAAAKIVTAADYSIMSSPGTLKGGKKTDYGMGLGINPLLGHKRIWHNGGTLGSFTMNGTYPNDHLDIVVFESSVDSEPEAIEAAALGAIFPGDLAASEQPAAGENISFRPTIMHYVNETLSGTMPASEMSAAFAKVATPQTQHRFATMFAKMGRPTAVIFRGMENQGDDIVYRYRLKFARSALRFILMYNVKTKLVDGIGLQPTQ